jgi:predicted metal-dependent hydrolase
MVHLLERHDNDTFTALMNKFLPQWQLRRKRTERATGASDLELLKLQ